MKEIIPSFKDSLLQDSNSLIKDYIEIGIDSVLDEGILKDLPIIGTIVGLSKTAENIRDRNLLKNLYVFIQEINSGTIDRNKLEEYKRKLDSDKKFAEKELGRVLILLDKYIDNKKACFLAKLFKAYINELINWDVFCEYSEIINRLFIQDVELLRKIYLNELNDQEEEEQKYRIDRLVATGLIKDFNIANMLVTEDYIEEHMGEYGKKFVKIVIVDDIRV